MVEGMIRLALPVFAVLLPLHAGRCAGSPDFSVGCVEVECGGRFSPLFGDLDGDGNDDVLIWDEDRLRFFRVGDNGFSAECGEIELPAEARLFDVGDLDGDGSDEVVYLCSKGVRSFVPEPGRPPRPERIVDTDCALPGRYVGPGTLIADVDRDGRDDLCFLAGDGIRTHLQTTRGRLVSAEPVPVPRADRTIEPKGAPFKIRFLDADGDERDDLLCLTPDALSLFRGTGGRFDRESSRHLPLSSYLEEADGREIVDENLDDVSLFEDVTGDGRKDFFLSSWSRGRVYLFRGAEAFFEPEACEIFEVGPIVTGVNAVESSASERPALVIHRYELPGAAGALFRVITRRKITVKFCFLLYEPEGTPDRPYPEEPSSAREIAVQVRRGDERTVEPRLIVRGADFNGDGWDDVAVLGESSSIEFFWAREPDQFQGRGRIPPIFSQEQPEPMSLAEFSGWTHRMMLEHLRLGDPDRVVPIPPPRGFMIPRSWTPDLNGDGRDDLILPYYPADESDSQKVVILLSRD